MPDIAWMKDVLLPLLIDILATAVVFGSLFVVCNILYKLITEWRQSRHARGLASVNPSPTSPDSDSGEQHLPQGEDMEMGPMNSGEGEDMEMGPMNSGEVANLPDSSSPGDGIAAEGKMEMISRTTNALKNVQPYSGEAVPR